MIIELLTLVAPPKSLQCFGHTFYLFIQSNFCVCRKSVSDDKVVIVLISKREIVCLLTLKVTQLLQQQRALILPVPDCTFTR